MAELKTGARCPVSATLKLIGGKYKGLILWHLTDQTMRFSQLRKLMPQATAKMLTQQLRELEEDGLLHREVYPVVPPKVEYSLTQKGRSLRPVLQSMFDWGSGILRENGLEPDCSMVQECGCEECQPAEPAATSRQQKNTKERCETTCTGKEM